MNWKEIAVSWCFIFFPLKRLEFVDIFADNLYLVKKYIWLLSLSLSMMHIIEEWINFFWK